MVREPGMPVGQTIGIMPIQNDRDRFVDGLLKTALSKAGYTCVELKDSTIWSTIEQQFAWSSRKTDILDPDTLLEFKKLMNTQLIMYGVVREASESIEKVYIETEFHISSLESTQHLWGGIFSRRDYLTADADGIVTLDPEVKQVLDGVVKQVVASMKTAPKLSETTSMVVVPVTGDIENYVKGLMLQVMTNQTGYFPRDPGVKTLAEARHLLRTEPDRGDAVLYGSVRELSQKLKSDMPLKQVYTITAELQFTVQNVQTGDVLWSVTQSDTIEKTVEKPKEEAAYSWIRENSGLVKIILIVLGVLVLLVIYAFISRPRKRK